jgi:acyl-CoA synthetase (AMP-forming)/AMP-acid ligase II
MKCYDPYSSHTQISSDWFKTGDLVNMVDDRVYFIGRRSDMINVGGNKVYPIEIERVIRSVPGVSDVLVYGRSSSIVGELVVCEVVPDRSQPGEPLKDAITERCLAQLAAHQRPRLIEIVDQIALSETGKRLRRIVS